MFDTFISYRRVGGSSTAARVHDYLKLKGYNPFYDITGMGPGRFDEQLRSHLIASLNFVLILSKGALDRCSDEEDWVRKEISTALKHNLNIVVLKEEGFEYPDNLPEEINVLPMIQAIDFDDATLFARLDIVCNMLQHRREHNKERPIYSTHNRKTFKIADEYVSYYEDIENGHVVMRRAPVVLRNFFGRITGRTWFGAKQSWRIRAHLYGKRRLAGTYFAESSIDDGIGTFFLTIVDANTMEGFWSGYDNENNTLTSGKYIFKRKYKNFTIRKATVADFAAVIKIADSQLGKGYLTKERLQKAMDKSTSDELLIAVQTSTNTVVGFSLFKHISHEEALKLGKGYTFRNMVFEEKIGYLATVATKEGFTGLGIATVLVDKSLENMKDNGITHFISTAWKHYGVINIGSVLENAGFRKEEEIPNYWYDASIKEKFQCPHCGNPCTCSCVIYTKI
ncbi:MAG: GNAT family N-acetyltransferase [Clostridia bacterium]|nr:GNAT family N-acetyltransferase [Clostridia bacterium]